MNRSAPPKGYININYYPYIINERLKCKNLNPFLVLIIATVAAEVENRKAIRKTWGNESFVTGKPIVRLFLLGTDSTLDHNIIGEESEQYHDIIQMGFQDTYKNLTIKTMMGIDWVANYCPGAQYVMKTDSDMFVNTNYLVDFLGHSAAKENYFTGYLMLNHQPHRNKDSKWHMPYSLYPGGVYPSFCSGTGYVFSGDIATKILRASFKVKFVYLEDVFVGICLDKEGIQITHPPNSFLFNNYRVAFDPCSYRKLITSHYINPSELTNMWIIVNDPKVSCES
ncbi:beta-1,3-galactosyltransferase 2-like [Hyperolius riggenbachi]|uniref:beta-1,3-galactosyltransferase 2-like n=1 Tax=Hyperolius riggenbachi TaxID=752182 RepID=UPI0035A34FFD